MVFTDEGGPFMKQKPLYVEVVSIIGIYDSGVPTVKIGHLAHDIRFCIIALYLKTQLKLESISKI